MIKIIQKRKIWFAFSAILISASIAALSVWGLNLGIDFTGGTLMEFSFEEKTLNSEEIKNALKDLDLGEVNVQFSGDDSVLLRFKDVDEDTHQEIIKALDIAILGEDKKEEDGNNSEGDTEDVNEEDAGVENEPISGIKKAMAADEVETIDETNETEESGIEVITDSDEEINIESEEIDLESAIATNEENSNIKEKRFDSIGPVIGNELKSTAVIAIVIALIAIVLYIGWAFRKVSRPVSSFKYGIIATITLFHDIIITLGVFAVLGHLCNVEVGIPFVAALLAILGYSVNDTIVVFDRTRENLIRSGADDFEKVVNKSVNETLIRSLNTSFTTLLVLVTLFLFGGTTIKYFVVALMVGISAGTYSSIFIASPLLVTWQKWSLRKQK
ncbi:MAG: protein translocase subunit SecF [Candidatus Andersenbacteria bacterium]|nr:protein translocase subunit SecF [Candidatus Andersenbacteria bacterium]